MMATATRSRPPHAAARSSRSRDSCGQFPTRPGRFSLAYAESVSAVDHFIGTSRRGGACARSWPPLADGATVDEAFRAATGDGLRRLRGRLGWHWRVERRRARSRTRAAAARAPVHRVPERDAADWSALCYAERCPWRHRATRPGYGYPAGRVIRGGPRRPTPRAERLGQGGPRRCGQPGRDRGVRASASCVDGAWGFASSGRDGRSDGRRGRCAGRAHRPRLGAPLCAAASCSTTGPSRHGSLRDARGGGPLQRAPSTTPWGCCSTRSAPMAAVTASTISKAEYHALREWKTYLASRRLGHRAGHHPRRRRHRGQRRQRRRPAAAHATRRPAVAIGPPATSTSAASTCSAGRRTLAEEAVELLAAPVLPPGRRTIVLHPSQLYLQIHESCGHPTELDRVFGTEAAYAGTSFLTTDKLEQGFRYGSRPGRASSPTPRRPAAWARSAGTTRGSPHSACRSSARASSAATSPAARPPRASGAAERRRHPRRRLEPPAAHPHDQHQPRAPAGDEPRGHHRRHRRRAAPREQPQLVHRRPPPQLPVRRRGGARDQGRQGGPALSQRHLHGHHPGVLGLVRRGRATSAAGCSWA